MLFCYNRFVDGMERCLSGWKSRSWKPVTCERPWVRIPLSPPFFFNIFELHAKTNASAVIWGVCVLFMEKYSRGRRGAPAKGVGRVTGARVQIPPFPPKKDKQFYAYPFLLSNSGLNPLFFSDLRRSCSAYIQKNSIKATLIFKSAFVHNINNFHIGIFKVIYCFINS